MSIRFNHKDNKNEKKQIWMYAVILFTGAFIILLLTAYSQVKFQNNISEYQNKLSSEEKAKINVVTNLNTVLKENEKLKADIEAYKLKIVDEEKKTAIEEEKRVEVEKKYSEENTNADKMIIALEYFSKRDYVNCAIILKYEINQNFLSSKATQSYNNLVENTYGKASKLLYLEGYRNFKKGNYSEAIISLNRSIDLSKKNEYYIDDAYFYLANSYYKTSNFEEAKKIINSFMISYSDSSLIQDMAALLKRII